MNLFVSADDLGLTRGITDGILEASDQGLLSGASVLAAGEAFDYAIEQWRERPSLHLTVHLNLLEGAPVAPPGDVDLLLDSRGEMGLSFVALLTLSLRLRGEARRRLREQIRIELDAQIRKVAQAAGPSWRPRVDGHQHYHMIPIVLDALLDLHEQWNFSYVRTTEEPLYLARPLGLGVPNFFSSNLAKLGILRVLGRQARRRLDGLGIPHPRWFVGLLFSGRMTVESVRAALAHLHAGRPAWDSRDGQTVEILLHPGRAAESEAARWSHRPDLADYYRSPWRDRERSTLCSKEFAAALEPYLDAGPGAAVP